MGIEIETTQEHAQPVTLGIVDTEVTHIRTNGNRAVVGWRTTVGTREAYGFDVAGSHLFVFDNNKIKSLRVNVSPKADQSHLADLKHADLSVTDVDRLSLAAWMVV